MRQIIPARLRLGGARLSQPWLAGALVVVLAVAGFAVPLIGGAALLLAGLFHLSRRAGAAHRSTQEAVRDLRGAVDELQRRVIAAVERERLEAGDRHQELTEAVTRAERLTGRGAELLLREQSREIEALFQLFQAVTPRAPMPPGDGLQPTDLLGLVHAARELRPASTVVLGSGPSTVWLGYALPGARLTVVDHDAGRLEQVRTRLAEHGLPVTLRHAPLAELSVDGRTVDWYDVDALDGVTDIGLLVVDGTLAPPGPDPLAPALHVLGRRLAPGAAVVVDDEPNRVAPRQGGGFGLTVRRPLPGRWTALVHPETVAAEPAVPVLGR